MPRSRSRPSRPSWPPDAPRVDRLRVRLRLRGWTWRLVDIEVADDRCTAIRLGLVCVYGADLQQEGRDARAAVASVVHELLGLDPAFDPERDITVEIVDVVEGDPHTQ